MSAGCRRHHHLPCNASVPICSSNMWLLPFPCVFIRSIGIANIACNFNLFISQLLQRPRADVGGGLLPAPVAPPAVYPPAPAPQPAMAYTFPPPIAPQPGMLFGFYHGLSSVWYHRVPYGIVFSVDVSVHAPCCQRLSPFATMYSHEEIWVQLLHDILTLSFAFRTQCDRPRSLLLQPRLHILSISRHNHSLHHQPQQVSLLLLL